MKLKTCFLHIGTRKTGTTSIQKTLFNQRQLLRKAGFLYPSHELQHHFAASLFSSAPKELYENKRQKRVTDRAVNNYHRQSIKKLNDEIAGFDGNTLIVSTESMIDLQGEEVARLAAFFKERAEQVYIICYTRHPLAAAVSGLQQSLKVGAGSIAETLKNLDPNLVATNLPGFVDQFGKANIILRPFDRAHLTGGDVVTDFVSLIGLPETVIAELDNETANESVSREAIDLACALSEFEPRYKDGDWNHNRSKALVGILQDIPGNRFGLTEAQLSELSERCEPTLVYLKNEFDITLSEPDRKALIGEEAAWREETVSALSVALNDLCTQNEVLQAQNLFLKGELAVAKGDKERGRQMFQRAFMRDVTFWPAANRASKLFLESNKRGAAIALIEKFLALNPGHKKAISALEDLQK